MSNRLAFQTQLASIMEVLANAAVAEICKLVDDDYAVINLQMSQCQRENKALKRKLHLLELRMARGYAERRIRENSLNRSRVQVNAALSDKYRSSAAGVFSNQDELFGRQMNEDIWRDRDPSGAEVPAGHPCVRADENRPEDSSKSGSDSVLVKAETSDEGHTQQQLFIREDGVAEVVCEGGQTDFRAAQMDKADARHPRTRHPALEVSGSDKVLKSEPQFENAGSLSQKPSGGEGEAEFGRGGDCAPLQELFMQRGDNADPPRPSCSYAAGSGRTENRERPEVIEVESAEEGDSLSIWDSTKIPPRHKTLHRLNHFNSPPSGLAHLSDDFPVVASASAVVPNLSAWQQPRNSGPYQPRAGQPRHQRLANDKLFSCKFCGKAFNRPKKVEIHQRIHTGEKPFRCNTCGKFFAEAGNLKKHQKVHTGERPYSCTQCGKSFAWIRNLKTHQQKYHPDVFMAEELLSLGAVKN